MGNRHSTEQGETAVSGVSLSPDLHDDIIRDFQNKEVQDQWNVFRASVLNRRHDRHAQLLQAARQVESQQAARSAQAAERLSHLDNAIDNMNAKFADELIAANYDADHAIAQYSSLASALSTSTASLVDNDDNDDDATATHRSPCLGPRAHWMFCAQKYVQDTRPCDAYLAVLEKCVQDAIVHKELQE